MMTSYAINLEPTQDSAENQSAAADVYKFEDRGGPPVSFSPLKKNTEELDPAQSETDSGTIDQLKGYDLTPSAAILDYYGIKPRIPPASRPQTRFISLQKWEGVVLSVESDFFYARLVDQTNHQPDEEVEIPREEVSFDDESLLTPGAIFYWSIGYSHDITGGRVRLSKMRFRRLPAWSQNDIERSQKRAEQLMEDLGWK